MSVTIWHNGSWGKQSLQRLAKGEVIVNEEGIYAMCGGCRAVTKLNRFIIGSYHCCDPQHVHGENTIPETIEL